MLRRKMIFTLVFSIAWSISSFAGIEDWTGSFTVLDSSRNKHRVHHTSKYIIFSFLYTGRCVYLEQGSQMHGFEIKDDINLCTNASVEEFTNEVKKLGPVVSNEITLGPTYPKE